MGALCARGGQLDCRVAALLAMTTWAWVEGRSETAPYFSMPYISW